jgi:DNA-binding MltR family transcriptional regulator
MSKRPRPLVRKAGSRKKPRIPREQPEEVERYLNELHNQPDRSAAILAVSYLEWRVRQAIQATLYVWDDHLDRLFGTENNPPLLGFVDQCRVAYGIGLIGPNMLADLQTLAKVRNKFAHNHKITSFSHPEIWTLCGKLKSSDKFRAVLNDPDKHWPQKGERSEFLATVSLLERFIWLRASHSPPIWAKPDTGDSLFW